MRIKNTLLIAGVCLLSNKPEYAIPATLLAAIYDEDCDDDVKRSAEAFAWGGNRTVEDRSGNKHRKRWESAARKTSSEREREREGGRERECV